MNDDSGWIPVPLPRSARAVKLDPDMEFYYREFDTSVPEEADHWRAFLYDPLEDLVNGGLIRDREGWRAVTTIINHHRPLNPRIGTAFLLKTKKSKEIAISIYKLEED